MTPTMLVAAPEDHDRVRNIVGALSESDLDVYWERTAPRSPKWPQAAARVLASRAVLLFWSEAAQSEENEPYRILARRAMAAGVVIFVRLDSNALPQSMSGCTSYDLRGWRARTSSLFMLDLIAGVKAKAAGLDPPLPRAPRQLLLKRLAIAFPSAVAAIALFIGLYRDIGIDRIAGPAEAQAWATIRPGSCEDLRGFLSAHSDGVHAAEAQALLDGRAVSAEIRWLAAERPLPLFVAVGNRDGQPDEPRARQTALSSAGQNAQRSCRGLAEAGSARFRSASVRAHSYECERFRSGTVCALEGEAVCVLEEPRQTVRETCGRRH